MPEYLFVTGRLAAAALRSTLDRLELDFDYEVAVLDISVAALMRAEWVARRLSDARGCRQVMVPGLCRGDLAAIERKLGIPAVRGPKDQKDLPPFFGKERVLEGYGEYHTKILAEIVEAYQMPWEAILDVAEYYRQSGADIIDLGCPPMEGFPGVGDVVTGLKERGFAVSVDTFDPETIREADAAGVDLLLSVNSENMDMVPELRCKVVVIPDFGEGLDSLEGNIARVESLGASYVVDPILDPLSFGFTESLLRYHETRRRHPEAEILMGLGNLTELTDADSTGINAVMAGVMAELEIDYVLTTEVISWARGSVRELDLARRLMHYANKNRMLPKSIEDSLIALKDPPFETYSEEELREIQRLVRDTHYRIFADREWVYVFNRDTFLRGVDPYDLFSSLDVTDPGHAFYLGRELERAALAVLLRKKYTQESELRWGYLSPEPAGR
ncbi:MAG: PTS mannitol transporter subunit IIABC [Actinobacteria bacterium]|nr:PTS mannitol transporter subunit IIABC [Actinomycetota bacterium]